MAEIDLEPQELDLLLYAGDGVSFRLVVTDKNGDPVNLTGVMKAQIRHKRTSEDPEAEFNIDLSESIDGIARLSLTGEQTQLLTPTKNFVGVWDVEWTPLGEEPRTFCQGKVECSKDVSH